MSDFLLDPETARYAIDQVLVRLDIVTWFISGLAAAILLRVVVAPLVLLLNQVQITTVAIIGAAKRPKVTA